LFLLRT